MPGFVQTRAAPVTLALALAVLAVLAGCATPAAEPEVSVHPGINDSYVDADVGQWVERFEREGREIYDRRHDIVAACALRPGMDVADVGAGTGLFVPLLADAVGPDGTVYAVEIVPEFVDHLSERAAAEGLTNVRAVLCTERSVELPPRSVDVVFTCDVYHHFEYPRSTMTSIHRALRPGGTFFVVDFERVPGESSDWILGHVRAGKDEVRAEIESFGFEFVEEIDLLRANYVMRFRRK
jgi:predicted methyltransferase